MGNRCRSSRSSPLHGIARVEHPSGYSQSVAGTYSLENTRIIPIIHYYVIVLVSDGSY